MMRPLLLFLALLAILAACDGTETDDPDADRCEPCVGEPLPECVDFCAPPESR